MDIKEIEYLQSKFINDIANDLSLKKKQVLIDRLSKNNIDIDFEEQYKKRFKDICITIDDNEETYWYNDGTETGLRIVTFVNINSLPSYDFESNNFSITNQINYY